MAAKAFSTGQRFRFPGETTIYVFISIRFQSDETPIITYSDEDGNEAEAYGFDLFDLIRE